MTAYPLAFESAEITPDMWANYAGSLEGFMKDLGEQMPHQLFQTAFVNHGLRPAKSAHVEIKRKIKKIVAPNQKDNYYIYKLHCSAWFTVTRCMPELNHHQHPHSERCLGKQS